MASPTTMPSPQPSVSPTKEPLQKPIQGPEPVANAKDAARLEKHVEARLHPKFKEDLDLLLKHSQASEEDRKEKSLAFDRMRNLIQSIGTERRFDLLDISIDKLDQSRRPHNAPLECVIIDKNASQDRKDDQDDMPYDCRKLTKLLGSNGYEGVVSDINIDGSGTKCSGNWAKEGLPASFDFASNHYDVLPPVVVITKLDNAQHSIVLNPVHPSHEARYEILKKGAQDFPCLTSLLSVFWLWLQSWGMTDISPTASAYIVLYFFTKKNPDAQASDTSRPNAIPPTQDTELTSESACQELESNLKDSLESDNPSKPADMDTLVSEFFNFLTFRRLRLSTKAIEPSEGRMVNRINEYIKSVRPEKEGTKQHKKGKEPNYWKFNPLVIKDPLLPQHNVTHMLTGNSLHTMTMSALSSIEKLCRTHPIFDIFGNPYPINKSSEMEPSKPSTILSQLFHRSLKTQEPSSSSYFKYTPVEQRIIQNRLRTIRSVESAIQSKFGAKYRVACFGSTCYGVDNAQSDLDLVVLDPDRMSGCIDEEKKLPAIYNIRHLARVLGWHKFKIVSVIPWASVPVVKLEDPSTGIACDINVNDQLGFHNTNMISGYCSLSPHLVPLLRAIKTWAKSFGLNDPSGANGISTFSSYSLTLMTIAFLQSKQLLPNLQANLPEPSEPPVGFNIRSKDGSLHFCDYRFIFPPLWTPPDPANIIFRDILFEWFRYWGDSFDFSSQVASIREGGIVPRLVPFTKKNRDRKKPKNEKAAKGDDHDKEKNQEGVAVSDGLQTNEANPKPETIGIVTDVLPPNIIEEAVTQHEEVLKETKESLPAEENVTADGGKTPSWGYAQLVVADPFILKKNATSSITGTVYARFRSECVRAMFLIEAGAPFEALLGDGVGFGRIGSGRGFPNGRENRGRTKGNGKGNDRKQKSATDQGTHAAAGTALENREQPKLAPASQPRSGSRKPRGKGRRFRGGRRGRPEARSENTTI